MKINLRTITVMLGLLAIASILVPTQTQIFASTDTEPRQLDIEEAGDDDNNAEMLLMTTKEGNNKPQKVQGFRLTPDNVIFVEIGKNVQVTDDESFFRSIVTDTKDNDKRVPISQQGVVDLRGIKQGPYTLDVVIQDGSRKIAYEVVLYIGPDNDNNRNTANKEVERVNKDVTINKKIVKIEKNVTECGKGTKFSERTGKCEIVPPTKPPTKPPTPKAPTTTTTTTTTTTPPAKAPAGGAAKKTPTPPAPKSPSPSPGAPTPPSPGALGPGPGGPTPDCDTGDLSNAIQCVTKGGNTVNVFPKGTVKVPCPQFSSGQCIKIPGGPLTPIAGGLIDLPNGQLGVAGPPSLTGPLGPLDPNKPVGALIPACPPGGSDVECIPGPALPGQPIAPPKGTLSPAGPSPGGPTPPSPGGSAPSPGAPSPSPGGPTGGPAGPAGPAGPGKPSVNCMENPTHKDCVDDPTKGPVGTFWAGPDTQVIPGPDGTLTLKRPGQPDVTLPPLSIPGFSAKPGWTFKVTPGSHITLFPPLWGTGLPGAPGPAPAPGTIGPDGLPVPTPPTGGAVGQGAAALPTDQPGIAAIQPPAPPELPPDTELPPTPEPGTGPGPGALGLVEPGAAPPTIDDCLASQNQIPGCEQVNPDPGHVITPPTPTGPEDCPSGQILESFPPKCAPLPEPTDGGPPLTVDPPAPPIDPGHIACQPGQVSTPENPCNPTGTDTTEPIPDPVPTDPSDCPSGRILESFPPKCAPVEPEPTAIPDPCPEGGPPPCEEPTPIPDPEPSGFCENPANQDLPQCQGTDTGGVVSGPGPGDPCDTDPNSEECLNKPIPDPTPEEATDETEDPGIAPTPTEEDMLFGDDTTQAVPPDGQDDREDSDNGLVPPTPDTTTEQAAAAAAAAGGSTGSAAASDSGAEPDPPLEPLPPPKKPPVTTQPDAGTQRTTPPPEGTEDYDGGNGNLVPPTPDTTAEGSTNEDENGGGGLGSTMDETNPQDRPAGPPAPPVAPDPTAPVDCLNDPINPECPQEPPTTFDPAGPPTAPPDELDCGAQGLEEEDGQCVAPEPEEIEPEIPDGGFTDAPIDDQGLTDMGQAPEDFEEDTSSENTGDDGGDGGEGGDAGDDGGDGGDGGDGQE